MPALMSRRAVLVAAGTACALSAFGRSLAADREQIERRLAALEVVSGGRLGVAILDPERSATVNHRGGERFAMCSTFKVLACAALLARIDRGEDRLDRRVFFAEKDVLTYSPASKAFAGPSGMTLDAICEAALTLSDNTAANLILAAIGGPSGVTAFARAIGDGTTRLDRIEPELNEATPGDPRDTTTPLAMLDDLSRILLGDILSAASRAHLEGWMVASKTGRRRLRAGLPKDWTVGDKTGGGDHGATNDIAVIKPPGRGPLLVTAYFAEAPGPMEGREQVLAEIGRIVAEFAS